MIFMALPKKFLDIQSYWRLSAQKDWESITPGDVLLVQGVGQRTLDRLRLYLAHRGTSLQHDNPPEYWLEHFDVPPDDESPVLNPCPFTILVDVNETYPWKFDSLTDSQGRPLVVPTRTEALYTRGLGDYAIAGFEQDFAIERKADDLPSSLAQRRENFEAEVKRLNDGMEFAAIIIEKSWHEYMGAHRGHGATIHSTARTWLHWMIRYPNVHLILADGREQAQQIAYGLMEIFYWHKMRSDGQLKRRAYVMEQLTNSPLREQARDADQPEADGDSG